MDLRVQRTQRNIINAFLQLRTKKPIEKITIKELSELAYIPITGIFTTCQNSWKMKLLTLCSMISPIRSV